MSLDLDWMRAEAPYMPIATVGLLSVLADAGRAATAAWVESRHGPTLHIAVDLTTEEVAQLVIDAPWPVIANVVWDDLKPSQGLKPTLGRAANPLRRFQRLCAEAPEIERKLLRATLTDGAVDGNDIPQRSRLYRGVKSDLSGVGLRPKKLTAAAVASELTHGPVFRSGSSGLGLGLVPEVQTFGGTTGPEPSSVGAYSPLLFLLLWHGLLALPPVAVRRGPRRAVGGPLVAAADVLSWPRWRYPASVQTMRSLLVWCEVHEEHPDADRLAARNVDRVYRARAVSINSMMDVYRWGVQVI